MFVAPLSVPHINAEALPKSARSSILQPPFDDNVNAFLAYNPAVPQFPLFIFISKLHLIPQKHSWD